MNMMATSTYVILPSPSSSNSSSLTSATTKLQSQEALANLAFRVRVFADHHQQHQHHSQNSAHAPHAVAPGPGGRGIGGAGGGGIQAESDLVSVVQGQEPIVDQIVQWQEQLPPIPTAAPFLHTHSHPQLVSHLASASRHAAARLTRSSAIDMHFYLSIPAPSSTRNVSTPSAVTTYTLARMRLSPSSGALSVSPPLGTLARLAPESSVTANARALPWIYVVELHITPLPQAQVLDTLRLGLASLKQAHLQSPLPPTRLLSPPAPDLRHTQRVTLRALIQSLTLRISEPNVPLYASHVSVAWRIEVGSGGWHVADDTQGVLAGTSQRVRVDAPSLWAYAWAAVWRWVWMVLVGGVVGAGGSGDGRVRRVAVGVPVEVVLVQRAVQADPSARPLLHLTIHSDPPTTRSTTSSRSSTRPPNRYLIGTCTLALPLTPQAAASTTARAHAIHRPVLPPSARMTEAVFGTPALPAGAKWPTAVAGHVEVAASVAVQAARAGGGSAGGGSGGVGLGLGLGGGVGMMGGAGGGVNAESVQAAVVRARSRLAAIKAAQAGPGTGT